MKSRRALRRHHRERIRNNYRKIAERWAKNQDSWRQVKHHFTWGPDGKMVSRVAKLNPNWRRERIKYIERTILYLEHHGCGCKSCHPKYSRRKKSDQVEKHALVDQLDRSSAF